jgi:hypothetical protein
MNSYVASRIPAASAMISPRTASLKVFSLESNLINISLITESAMPRSPKQIAM